MEAFIATVSVSILGAFVWLAYHHPAAIRRISWHLTGLSWAVGTVLMIWYFAVLVVHGQLQPFMQVEKLDEARITAEGLKPQFWVIMVALVGVPIFIILLTDFVADLKNDGKDEE